MNKIDKLFLKELGIEQPTPNQIKIISYLSEAEKSIPIIFAELENGKSYARIAQQLSVSKGAIQMRVFRLKKNGHRTLSIKKKI